MILETSIKRTQVLINLSPQKICQKFAQFEIRRVINIFSNWDKHTLVQNMLNLK